MLLDVLIAAEDLGRLRDITRILVQFGFEDLAQRMGLVGLLQRTGRVLRIERVERLAGGRTAERTRHALEALGPTFVKLGQLLATRTDLLPPEWIDELCLLQSNVGSVPWEELRPQLLEDLGAPPEEVFDELDTRPLAAGSIAQVHRARLRDGRAVVLKIRRPGVEKRSAADLRLLARLAEILEREVSEFRRFRPTLVVRQFARSLEAELDFNVEAQNTRAIASNLADLDELVVPEVFPQHSSQRLLVLSYVEGHPADAWIRGERRDEFDGPHLADVGARTVLRMVFLDGFYHADPHPGNVLFLPEGRVGLLDFGMVGRLSETRRRQFALLLAAVIDRDEAGLVDALLEWSDGSETDTELLLQDCDALLDRYATRELKDLDAAAMLTDLARVVRENDLILPADVAGLIKVFLTLEGLGRRLDPRFSLDAHLAPLATGMLRDLTSPRRIFARNWRDFRRLAIALPHDLQQLLQRLRRGGFKVELDLQRLEALGRQLDHSANRITVGLITSALIIGTSIVLTTGVGPKLFGLPLFGFLGFGTSFVIGLFLLWSILRSGIR